MPTAVPRRFRQANTSPNRYRLGGGSWFSRRVATR
jgi:hypothetical protein